MEATLDGKPMTDEAMEEFAQLVRDDGGKALEDGVRDLIAEVKRLRAELEAADERSLPTKAG